MKNPDRTSGLFLLGFGVLILVLSIEYPLGSFEMPGAGVFPILASSLLIVVSGAIAIAGFLKQGNGPAASVSRFREPLGRVLVGVGALVAYRYLLTSVGFAPACFLFVFFLAKVLSRYTWKASFIFSFVTAVVCYYLFQVILKIPMPGGIFGI